MKNIKLEWLFYTFKWKWIKLKEKITGKLVEYNKANQKTIYSGIEANQIIYDAIVSGKPFAVTRYGMWELECSVCTERDRIFGTKSLEKVFNPGIFSTIEEMKRWQKLVKEDSKEIDYSAVWFRVKMEDWILKEYAPNAQYIHYSALEPYYFDYPWSYALKGKKVLVINPFDKLIEKQYFKHKEIFENKEILPEFELKTMKSIWFIDKKQNADFPDWFAALGYMKGQLCMYDFDIAIIGCGPFGIHLAAEIKRMGKQAIVVGGATQILFGIKGKRWDEIEQISSLYNETWVRPTDEDKPKANEKLDEGCYW